MSTMGRDADEQARCEREETQNLFSTDSRLVVRCAADIKPEKVDWLWEQRLPLGSVCCCWRRRTGQEHGTGLARCYCKQEVRRGRAVKASRLSARLSSCRQRTTPLTPSCLGSWPPMPIVQRCISSKLSGERTTRGTAASICNSTWPNLKKRLPNLGTRFSLSSTRLRPTWAG